MQLAMSISPIPGVPHESTQLIMSHIIWQESDLCWMPKRPLWPRVFIFDTNYATSQSVLEHRASHTQKYTFINILYSLSCCFKSGFFFCWTKKKIFRKLSLGFYLFCPYNESQWSLEWFSLYEQFFSFFGGGGGGTTAIHKYTQHHMQCL